MLVVDTSTGRTRSGKQQAQTGPRHLPFQRCWILRLEGPGLGSNRPRPGPRHLPFQRCWRNICHVGSEYFEWKDPVWEATGSDRDLEICPFSGAGETFAMLRCWRNICHVGSEYFEWKDPVWEATGPDRDLDNCPFSGAGETFAMLVVLRVEGPGLGSNRPRPGPRHLPFQRCWRNICHVGSGYFDWKDPVWEATGPDRDLDICPFSGAGETFAMLVVLRVEGPGLGSNRPRPGPRHLPFQRCWILRLEGPGLGSNRPRPGPRHLPFQRCWRNICHVGSGYFEWKDPVWEATGPDRDLDICPFSGAGETFAMLVVDTSSGRRNICHVGSGYFEWKDPVWEATGPDRDLDICPFSGAGETFAMLVVDTSTGRTRSGKQQAQTGT
ncbi:uncharacterized protein LOC121385884 [Gigantopelta aegis]|uniref:uncharacterized protein LOC121385884 n=1 Tax=Gigantopelta aegis TaxID=1735272 RepID=UPI001B889F40|nr:uncharacterized protein LOC121385884 [Gigantopelta aegis]